MKRTILIIDDEADILDLVTYNLGQAGFNVVTARDGTEALAKIKTHPPHLILLDLMLPQIDGLELCKMLRYAPATSHIPIIMLTAKAAEIDRVLGLELGADDYVTKPFSPRELVLRIKKLLDHPRRIDGEQYRCGSLFLDVPRHTVTVNNDAVDLTATEFRLLTVLLRQPGIVQTRERLLKAVWEYEKLIDTRTVDTHVRRLREKLGRAADYIKTERGVGYRCVAP